MGRVATVGEHVAAEKLTDHVWIDLFRAGE
jgi:hypothetical protein